MKELLSNRTKFKLFAAKQHLNILKNIDNNNSSLVNSYETRIQTEIALDCFLNSLISARESLLFTINEKLKLGLSHNKITLKVMNKELYKNRKTNLLCKLTYLTYDEFSWLSLLNELRNHSHHRTNISLDIRVNVGIGEIPTKVYLIDPREQILSKEEKIKKKREEAIVEFYVYLNNNKNKDKNKTFTDDEWKELIDDFIQSWTPKGKKMMMIPTLEELYKNMKELIDEIESLLNE